MKKFTTIYIKESISDDVSDRLSEDNKDVKVYLIKVISQSLNTSDVSKFVEFCTDYIKDSDKNIIKGLTNDNELDEFYKKFGSDIDEVLNKVKHYSESPEDLGTFSLYQYMIKSIKRSIKELVATINEEITKEK